MGLLRQQGQEQGAPGGEMRQGVQSQPGLGYLYERPCLVLTLSGAGVAPLSPSLSPS